MVAQNLKSLDFTGLSMIDKWVLDEAFRIFSEVDRHFSMYDFSKGFQALNGFITATLSGIYLDICKDSLYCDSVDSKKRLAIQSVFAILANKILLLLAPFLTYTIDEALEYAEKVIKGDAKNVFELRGLEYNLSGWAAVGREHENGRNLDSKQTLEGGAPKEKSVSGYFGLISA